MNSAQQGCKRSTARAGATAAIARAEIRAYQLCKVDDTWAEAAHRDASRFYLVRSRSQLPYAAASFRIGQTLAAVDAMSPDELRFFTTACAAIRQSARRLRRELWLCAEQDAQPALSQTRSTGLGASGWIIGKQSWVLPRRLRTPRLKEVPLGRNLRL